MISLGFIFCNLFDILDDLPIPKVLLHALSKPVKLPLSLRIEHLIGLLILPVVLLQYLAQLLSRYVVLQHQLAQLLLAH